MSFLNWAGGKSKLLGHLSPHIPKEMHDYYEPFLGGGSVLLYVLDQVEAGNIVVHGRFVCADINKALIVCYKAIKQSPEKVIHAYENMCEAYEACPDKLECKKKSSICLCKECYYFAIRAMFNAYLKAYKDDMMVEIAAQFLFLNATCYRGLYRESKNGVMNSCYWTSRTIVLKSTEIREASRLFKKYNVQFFDCSYKDFLENCVRVVDEVEHPHFIFFDPPYIPLKQTNLISNEYNKEGFDDDDTIAIVDWMNAHKTDMNIVFCNHHTEPLLELCNRDGEWPVCKKIDVRRNMKYAGASVVAQEVIVSNVATN